MKNILALGFIAALALPVATVPSSAAWRNGHPAKVILDEGFAFANGGNIFVTDATTYGSEMLIVPDRDNNRVVIYKTAPTANDAAFDIELKGNMAAPNNGFNDPLDACIGPAGQLVVVDRTYNRVLIWKTFPATGDAKADITLGQENFAGQGSNRGDNELRDSNTMSSPEACAVFGDKLFVVDAQNHRVLIWNTFPTVDGQPADIVIGQESAKTGFSDRHNATYMSTPRGIAVSSGGKLLVGQQTQNRVMIWNTIPTMTGQKADVFIGQPDPTSFGFVNDGTPSGLREPIGVAVSRDGKVAVGDKIHGRVLIWNSIPTTNNAAADFVLGQRNLTTSDGTHSFDLDDIRYVGGALGVEWTADGKLWVNASAGKARLFDPNFAPEVAEYVYSTRS